MTVYKIRDSIYHCYPGVSMFRHLSINYIKCTLQCNNYIMKYMYEDESSHILCKLLRHVPLYRSHREQGICTQKKQIMPTVFLYWCLTNDCFLEPIEFNLFLTSPHHRCFFSFYGYICMSTPPQ